MCSHNRSDDYVAPDGYGRCRRCHLDSASRNRERTRAGMKYVPPERVKHISKRQEEAIRMDLRALELMGEERR